VDQAVRWFAGSGVGIVSLHVFAAATVPRFWDRPEHDHAAWSREFLARNAPAAGRRLEVRSGWPSDWILEVAGTERADMIALGWRRRVAPTGPPWSATCWPAPRSRSSCCRTLPEGAAPAGWAEGPMDERPLGP
jgi:hypothetical protein